MAGIFLLLCIVSRLLGAARVEHHSMRSAALAELAKFLIA
jgi:hypothetical protein